MATKEWEEKNRKKRSANRKAQRHAKDLVNVSLGARLSSAAIAARDTDADAENWELIQDSVLASDYTQQEPDVEPDEPVSVAASGPSYFYQWAAWLMSDRCTLEKVYRINLLLYFLTREVNRIREQAHGLAEAEPDFDFSKAGLAQDHEYVDCWRVIRPLAQLQTQVPSGLSPKQVFYTSLWMPELPEGIAHSKSEDCWSVLKHKVIQAQYRVLTTLSFNFERTPRPTYDAPVLPVPAKSPLLTTRAHAEQDGRIRVEQYTLRPVGDNLVRLEGQFVAQYFTGMFQAIQPRDEPPKTLNRFRLYLPYLYYPMCGPLHLSHEHLGEINKYQSTRLPGFRTPTPPLSNQKEKVPTSAIQARGLKPLHRRSRLLSNG